ncbi:hypothetical protein MKA27_17370 [[Clostridium] innocuum]|uniref:hypothetical protein n=1 Tax=Clostridium innocuum TaxID=1522 RepID=UPI0015E86F53|nr:hypothetical protein [[Clostridium] innocuum]MCR0315835.1 hypothetical protein [[Clostridium] innocuum]MCR0375582.1 hypothetical protein [[Clostridium] innocuum]MCR0560940.1 hypothetical protein [[Clostridium] innocuum]MCR0603714.1 hypothetical protein [[Clostridium] innocuum]
MRLLFKGIKRYADSPAPAEWCPFPITLLDCGECTCVSQECGWYSVCSTPSTYHSQQNI